MSRPRREESPRATAEEIKATVREQMRSRGIAGISLRAIARQMNITAPAIYNYYPRLEDLVTSLIVDAFNSLADAMQAAWDRQSQSSYGCQISLGANAYRSWALQHPVEFQLIYGNPIPGYHAPPDVTTPLARRPFEGLARLYLQAWQVGELKIPAVYQHIPPAIQQHLAGWKQQMGFSGPEQLLYLLVVGWSRIHGMLMLELFHHSQPVVGDAAAFYEWEVHTLLASLGMQATQAGS